MPLLFDSRIRVSSVLLALGSRTGTPELGEELCRQEGGRMAKVDRALYLGIRLGLVAMLCLGVASWCWPPPLTELYRQRLSSSDLARVQSVVAAHSIPYEVAASTILVPVSRRAELKAQLAQLGLPAQPAPGQDLKARSEQRGWVENDLAEVVSHFQGVDKAAVKFEPPVSSFFEDDPPRGRVLVMVHMKPEHELSDEQLQAVSRYAAWSLPGLSQDEVRIFGSDFRERTRWTPTVPYTPNPDAGLAAEEDRLSAQLTLQAQRHIDGVYGSDRAWVAVRAHCRPGPALPLERLDCRIFVESLWGDPLPLLEAQVRSELNLQPDRGDALIIVGRPAPHPVHAELRGLRQRLDSVGPREGWTSLGTLAVPAALEKPFAAVAGMTLALVGVMLGRRHRLARRATR